MQIKQYKQFKVIRHKQRQWKRGGKTAKSWNIYA